MVKYKSYELKNPRVTKKQNREDNNNNNKGGKQDRLGRGRTKGNNQIISIHNPEHIFEKDRWKDCT